VALSRGSPRVGVTHHPARWSPDFPRRARQPPYPPRSPGRLVPRTAYRCCGAAGPRIRQVGPRRPKRAPHPHPLRTSCVICAPGTPHAELQQLVRSGNRGWGGAGKSPSAYLRRRSSREGVLAPDSAVKRCLASFSISDPPDRARSHRSGADLCPVAREVEPRTPGHRSLVARRRETYAVRVRSPTVRGPRGAKRTPRTRNWWSLVARRRETYAVHARSTIVGGPAAQTVRRARPVTIVRGPAARDVRRARPVTIVGGPAARDVRRVRPVNDRWWPGGANRLSIPLEPGTSLARQRQPDRQPQVTPPQSPLRTR